MLDDIGNLFESKDTSGHTSSPIKAGQAKVNVDMPARKLNEILLSKDAWLTEMYLATSNRILSPSLVSEHKKIDRMLSPSKDAEKEESAITEIYLGSQNKVLSPSKTARCEETARTEIYLGSQ